MHLLRGLWTLQHARASWNASQALPYHAYVIQENVTLKDAVAFAYGASFEQDSAFSRRTLQSQVQLVLRV